MILNIKRNIKKWLLVNIIIKILDTIYLSEKEKSMIVSDILILKKSKIYVKLGIPWNNYL